MRKLLIPVLALTILAAAALPSGQRAVAASPWAGHWATAYIGDPHQFASLDIRGRSRLFYVELHDAIPAAAWHSTVCAGPADAWGIGTLVDSTRMRVDFLWRCVADGSFHFDTLYLWLNTISDANPANDSIVTCTGLTIGTCSQSFSRAP